MTELKKHTAIIVQYSILHNHRLLRIRSNIQNYFTQKMARTIFKMKKLFIESKESNCPKKSIFLICFRLDRQQSDIIGEIKKDPKKSPSSFKIIIHPTNTTSFKNMQHNSMSMLRCY
jgi:hypothetical protein